MIQNKIKLSILQGTEILWFLEGIKVTHSDAGNKTLAEQLFIIEHTINDSYKHDMRCHIECESKEME